MNKYGKYTTVIRLYDKYELEDSSLADPYRDKVKEQYEFAKDNIEQYAISDDGLGKGGSKKNLGVIMFSMLKPINMLML